MLTLENINIKKINNGDKEEFNRFYLSTIDFFFRWAKGMYLLSDDDINDILSEFYYRLWINVGKFPEEKKAFIKRIWRVFKNLLIDFFKKKDLIYFSEYNDNDGDNDNGYKVEELIISDDDILEVLEKDIKFEKIKEGLRKLKDKYKDVIFLKYIEGYSNSEIAEVLGISEELVRKRLSRGLKILKNMI